LSSFKATAAGDETGIPAGCLLDCGGTTFSSIPINALMNVGDLQETKVNGDLHVAVFISNRPRWFCNGLLLHDKHGYA